MTEWGLWGAPEWATPALLLLAVALAALLGSYLRAPSSTAVRTTAAVLKAVGLTALAVCLIEPLTSSVRPRPGENLFAVAVDDSLSMQIRDAADGEARGEALRSTLRADSSWLTRLGQQFDVRQLAFDVDLRGIEDFATLEYAGDGSSLMAALQNVSRRFRGLPLGGVLLMTDGNATDASGRDTDWSALPPIYPVVVGTERELPDVRVESVSVRQTNFETAPVTIDAQIFAAGADELAVDVTLLDENSKQLETQRIELSADRASAAARFQVRPERPGISIYRVTATAIDDGIWSETIEATEANNSRSVVVENGAGPYRVLYVSGRPNWDFKFLRRALAEDDQVELVGLIRIARREPKFTFRPRGEGNGNQLFEGFNRDDEETAERHDEPVLTRLGTQDEEELRDGFPQSADLLYKYDAIVLDDIEAEFFSQDQLSLLEGFVARRGGGLLMMGGVDSFAEGGYGRTPVGALLPVYLDDAAGGAGRADSEFRLSLTREGWLEDWVRLRKTEDDERIRLAMAPDFLTANVVGLLKPGATELAQVTSSSDGKRPALVTQRFGRGRTAALLIADLWRSGLERSSPDNDDLEVSWRQTVRWLVADVPRRVEVAVAPADDAAATSASRSTGLRIRVYDAEYLPLENAAIDVAVTTPEGKRLQLAAEADAEEPGVYVARHHSRKPGTYRARVNVAAPDGSPLGECETAWIAEPLADEFAQIRPNRRLLEEIAAKTGGEVVEPDDLDALVASLERRSMPITETRINPLWHHPAFFAFAVACLVAEWGLRRWKGLA